MFEGTKATGPLFFVVFVKGIGGVLSNGKFKVFQEVILTLEGWKGKTTFGVLDLPSKKLMITILSMMQKKCWINESTTVMSWKGLSWYYPNGATGVTGPLLWRVVFSRPKEKGDPGPSFGERWSSSTRMIPRKRWKENLGTLFLNVPWILKPPVYEATPFISFFFRRGGGGVHSLKLTEAPENRPPPKGN